MLSIRFQRTGRKSQAKFRVVVQESRRTPTSGRVVANLGHYDPHSKDHGVDFDRLQVYMKNGAQPSTRVVHLLTTNKIDLPAWVKAPPPRQKSVRNPDKLRRNRPAEEAPAEVAVDEPAPETKEEASDDKDSEVADDSKKDDTAQTDLATDAKPEPADKDQSAKTKSEVAVDESKPAKDEATKDQSGADDPSDPPAADTDKDQPNTKVDDSE